MTTLELRSEPFERNREPGFPSRIRTADGSDATVVKLVVAELIVLLLTQKFAIPLGDTQIQVSIAVHLLFIAIFLYMRLVRLSELQTLIYLGTAGLALLLHSIVTNHGYSLPSLLSYLVIYATTCFVIPLDREQYRRILLAFQTLATIACFGVWLDWAVQVCGLPMPNFELLIPRAIKLTNYMYIQSVVWGSPWNKPNAIIFPETSFISAFLGVAFVIEMGLFRRPVQLVLYGASMFATLGGSGMLLVALAGPFLVRRLSWAGIAGVTVAALVMVVVGAQMGASDTLAQRSQEFSNEDSSGYHRFVEPLILLGDSLLRDPSDALFGSGAGTAAKGLNIIWSPMAKAVNEYGLLFGVMFLLLTIAFMFGSGRPFIVSWACFVNYHLLGGGFVVPWYAVFAWVLVGGYDLHVAASRWDLKQRSPRSFADDGRARTGDAKLWAGPRDGVNRLIDEPKQNKPVDRQIRPDGDRMSGPSRTAL